MIKCPHCGKKIKDAMGIRRVPQKKCPRCGNNSYMQDRDGNWACRFSLCNYPDDPML